ncbi:MAG: ABC transporter ATP-binding protein [Lachnospiraceae bacterium]|nr:ABC transporter ATP-binding protein [Lachnospiraceae bacterium]
MSEQVTQTIPDAGDDIAIRVKDVSKKYENGMEANDDVYVLEHINIDVRKNEFVCVLGPSGCGKSTMLNMIAGYIKPSDGEIDIFGEQVKGASRRAGVVFQSHALMPWLTVRKNIMLGPKINKKSKEECEEIADKYIQMIGLQGMESYYPKQLSGGMAQRVGIARALANEPEILLMDEPLGALDAITRENMRIELLRIFEKEKITIFFITHSVQEAIYLADRVIVLKDKKVDCDVHIDLDRPRNMQSEKFIEYVKFFESKLGTGTVTSD